MHRKITVNTAADDYDLVTLDQAKTHLGITGSSSDAKLALWITNASAAIAKACDRVFARETVTETLYLNAPVQILTVRRSPIASITTLKVDTVALVAGTEYGWDADLDTLFRLEDGKLSFWDCGTVEINYVGGYDLTTDPTGAPGDLVQACLEMVSQAYASAGRDPLAKRIEIPDVQTTDYWVGNVGEPGKLPPSIEALIAPHRRWSI